MVQSFLPHHNEWFCGFKQGGDMANRRRKPYAWELHVFVQVLVCWMKLDVQKVSFLTGVSVSTVNRWLVKDGEFDFMEEEDILDLFIEMMSCQPLQPHPDQQLAKVIPLYPNGIPTNKDK